MRPAFLGVVNSPKLMDFFSRLLGGPSTTFDHKWLRVVPPGNRTRCLLHDRWTEDDARFAVPLAQVRARYDMRNVHVNSLSMDLASESRFSIQLFNGAEYGGRQLEVCGTQRHAHIARACRRRLMSHS